MSRKIAIITTKDFGCYECSQDVVIFSITEWVEVSDQDFNLLWDAGNKYNFRILEQPQDVKQFIGKTIQDYKEYIAKEDRRRKAEAAKLETEKR